jgi:hypothetical protein
LYSWAQAERLRGNCEEATRLYRKFLEGETTLAQREATRAGIERCAREPARPPPPLPSEPERDEIELVPAERLSSEPERPSRATAPARREAPRPEERGGAWYTDPLGAALLTSGGLCLAIGIGYTLAARQSRDAAEAAGEREDFKRLLAQANERRTIGTASLIAGAALTSGAVLRYVLRAREDRGPSVAVDENGSLLLVWAGRF